MTFIPSEAFKSINYPSRTVKRADRAIRCAPFQLHFFQTIRDNSVFLTTIASNTGVESGYTRSPVSELVAENSLVEKWEQQGNSLPNASLCDRLGNTVSRGFGLFL
jgi:hypothetical protein